MPPPYAGVRLVYSDATSGGHLHFAARRLTVSEVNYIAWRLRQVALFAPHKVFLFAGLRGSVVESDSGAPECGWGGGGGELSVESRG